MQSINETDLHLIKSGPCNASCIRFSLVKLLRLSGYDAAVCASRWQGSGKVPGDRLHRRRPPSPLPLSSSTGEKEEEDHVNEKNLAVVASSMKKDEVIRSGHWSFFWVYWFPLAVERQVKIRLFCEGIIAEEIRS
ncbi:hypothetical protein U1Q18_022170 [Sarracenia purpurea var. burkii]